jgi:hypothetical protein
LTDKFDASYEKFNYRLDRSFNRLYDKIDASQQEWNCRFNRLHYTLMAFLTALIGGQLALLAKATGVL